MRLIVLTLSCATILWGAASKRVWIDTDPSAAPGGHEVDDAFALLQAFGSPELSIRGISIVYGNADLATAIRIGNQLVKEFGPRSLTVFPGAAGPADLGRETEASLALAGALSHQKLTILALGPATNVATVVRNHPELAANIDEIIAVAARRPGQHFRAGPKQGASFRDFNFELDPAAFRVLLASRIKLTFAPWEVSSTVWLNRKDIADLARRRPRFRSLVPAVEDWLARWENEFGAPGFTPFDTLAVGYLVNRKALTCTEMTAGIEPGIDDTGATDGREKLYLVVRPAARTDRTVVYCHTASPTFKKDLLSRVAAGAR